jgi:hypothetical protein
MGWRAVIGLIAAARYLGATIPYIVATARQRITPSVVAWGGGAVISSISFAAQMSTEPSWSAGLSGVSACYCTVVVLLAWKRGNRQFGRLELICLALGVIAIVAWQLTDEAEVALLLSVVADTVVCVPMIVKTARHPDSELAGTFLASAVAAVVGGFSATHLDAVMSYLARLLASTERPHRRSGPSIRRCPYRRSLKGLLMPMAGRSAAV